MSTDDEDPHKALADLGSALLRIPGDEHRPLIGAVARCLCTAMHASHNTGDGHQLVMNSARNLIRLQPDLLLTPSVSGAGAAADGRA